MGTAYAIDRMDSRSFGHALAAGRLLIVPVGALEAHGPHLPLGADAIQARRTADELAPSLDALVAPELPYGSCPGARGFPGTVSLSPATLREYAREVLAEFARMGARRILVVSGHAERGHMAALRDAASTVMTEHPPTRIVVLSDYDFVYELRGELAPATDGHAGLLETSRVLAVAPESVGLDRPKGASRRSPFLPGSPSPDEWPESVQGDTTSASVELGQKIHTHVLRRIEATVRELLPA
ncbi:MAG TPA: creatininase family protein [Thermoplasmata archaeon]|nr:creatininase family protein [Thermoplasmata archaeon]